jgi:L-alanine-DL-glutamate epimerase-like enolase superfamily enzyme
MLPPIKSAERITLRVPFTARCDEWNAGLVWNWSIVEVLRLETEDGTVGWGETLPHYTWGRVPEGAPERAVGQNPIHLLGDDSLGCGLQMAAYDLVGKLTGAPVWQLFNLPRVRDWCPLAWWNTEMVPEALAEEAKEALAAGYTAHKFKARPWLDVWEQVERVSAVTPLHYKIDLDWNDMLLTPGNAVPVLQSLDAYERVALYEGPIAQRDVAGYRELRSKVAKPIAIHFGLPRFADCVRAEMCDGFVVSGGVASVLNQGALAAAFELPFWLQLVGTGLTTAHATHLGAVLPLARWPAITCLNNYADDLLVEPLEIIGGSVKVPEGPGLGVAFDESALEKYRMEPPYELPERRHLLTVIWPGGKAVHYAHTNADIANRVDDHFSHLKYAGPQGGKRRQLWEDCLAGNHPAQERGVQFLVRVDDGSKDFTTLWQRAHQNPVWDRV